MNPIHVQIITHNNEQHLVRCLLSLQPLTNNISIYDLGSTDGTIEIAQKYGQLYKIKCPADRSSMRNTIMNGNDSEWQMYLHPWETLVDYEQCLDAIKNTSSYFHLLILRNESITKEIRLWRKDSGLFFENYAFEMIQADKPNVINCMIHSSHFIQDYSSNITSWCQDKPVSSSPLYYKACQHLVKQEWSDFMIVANHYLMLETKVTMPVIMTKYYLAMIYFNIKKDYQMSIKHALEIVAAKPLMAEFWCLLGDIYYRLQEYGRAKHFYENALILSRKRATDDLWPLEINKYKNYPTQMIDNCIAVENNTVSKTTLKN